MSKNNKSRYDNLYSLNLTKLFLRILAIVLIVRFVFYPEAKRFFGFIMSLVSRNT